MKNALYILLLPLLFLHNSVYAQISVTASSTNSICFNDGTLTIHARGGTAPYTYKITSGPVNPNVTYPIVLPTGDSTFIDLPHGSYTIVVTDTSGHNATLTDSVGGTYRFPVMTLSYNCTNILFDSTCAPFILCSASGGLPPYQYAISSTGANSGFGPYQQSDTFANLCPGHYWVRVRDSCQNIYTVSSITFSSTLSYHLLCINYSKGFFTAVATGGHPPYTYQIDTFRNATGIFTGLPPYFSGTLSITDSCGTRVTAVLRQLTIGLFEVCPFDSNIYAGGVGGLDSLTYICTNCNPVQTVSGAQFPHYLLSGPDTVFRHVNPNQNYNIVIVNPTCGSDTLLHTLTFPALTHFTIDYGILSCNSFEIGSNTGFDSVIVRNSSGTIAAISHSGYFFDLPNGSYTATAYSDSANNPCIIGDSATIPITLPFSAIPNYCETVYRDSTCALHTEITLLTANSSAFQAQSYSLIYSPGDTLAPIADTVSNIFGHYLSYSFYNLMPGGNYTVISDSGCFRNITLDTLSPIATSAFSYVTCAGGPVIKLSPGSESIFCSDYIFSTLSVNDTLVHNASITHGLINVTDTGWYNVKWYIAPYPATAAQLHIDSACPIDSQKVYVTNSTIPLPYPGNAYICGANNHDTIHYQILGGSIPYTVEVPGYDTVRLLTTSGIFPTNRPGQYTMIVYDSCGISRSFTFSIIDTCNGCPHASITTTDTLYCAGDTIYLSSIDSAAVKFQWLVNGMPYSITADTVLIAQAGTYKLHLQVYSRFGCEDSATLNISVAGPTAFNIGPDTAYCTAFSRVLSTGIGNTVWSTGQTGAQIMVDTPGRYWATVTNKCGTKTDTVNVFSFAINGFNVAASQTQICNDRADSAIIIASVDSLTHRPVNFLWSTGADNSKVYSSAIATHTAGTYNVTVTDSLCSLTKTETITAVQCDSNCAHKIAFPDIFSPNGDGKNDTFFVLHTCPVTNFIMHIYNRWGQLVFESSNIDKGWDGTYGGKPQPEEVYLWFVCVQQTTTTTNNCSTGTLTLVR